MGNSAALVSIICVFCGFDGAHAAADAQPAPQPTTAADLTAKIEASPTLPFHGVRFAASTPRAGWETGMVSSFAFGKDGLVYELQRGDKADPVLVVTREGKLVRSWGQAKYQIPHAIRLDASGNVWTVDASASRVIEYSKNGRELHSFTVGEQPTPDNPFKGTTDIAFAPNGHVYITDGYGNARVLEYTPEGRRLKQWGTHGGMPGEFHLPHAIQISDTGIVYVADRENGRIEKFDLTGEYLGEIDGLGRTYSIKLAGDALWATMQPLSEPTGSAGWVVKLDASSGKILGHLDVPEPSGLHWIDVSASGEPVITLGHQLLWFRHN